MVEQLNKDAGLLRAVLGDNYSALFPVSGRNRSLLLADVGLMALPADVDVGALSLSSAVK